MASMKDFIGKRPVANTMVKKEIPDGAVRKITDCEIKQTSGSDEDCLAIKVEKFARWIRVNEPSAELMMSAWGEDTASCIGKKVRFSYENKVLDEKPIVQLNLTPVK